ncbi:MAG TPA: hypothetical protein VMU83_08840 [Hanamia sp.]|nr:hypothetical protein [Hanamia sp.]
MKTNVLLVFIAATIISSCSKKDTASTTTPPSSDSYINLNPGSVWNYNEIDSSTSTPTNSNYNVTSTSVDTPINNKKYHIYNYSYGGSEYLNLTGHDYYQYDSIPGGLGQVIERLYLEDNAAVNATWSQNFSVNITGIPFAIQGTLTNKIVETGISKMVNGTNYTGVIHVSTIISSSAIPSSNFTSSIDSYYAPNYGLIENSILVNLNYSGLTEYVNTKTQLMSAVLK